MAWPWPWKLSLSDMLYINLPGIFTNIAWTSESSCVYWANIKNNHVSKGNTSFWICMDVYISPRFFFDPHCHTTSSNLFYKPVTSIKLVTSVNSRIMIYWFQKNELFGTLIWFDDKPPLKDMICFILHELSEEIFAK